MSAQFSPEIDGATLVLLGSFNPAIFQPAWFKSSDLLSGPEADDAEVKIIHPAIAEFSTDWLQLSVIRDRFALHTKSAAHFEQIQDLAVGVFHLLEHTPVTAMGLNRDMHFRIENEERWHALGDRLAPKDIWSEKLRGIGTRDKPGLRSMTVMGYPPEKTNCLINVRVEPSANIRPGLYVGCNRHYKIDDFQNSLKALMDELAAAWVESLEYALEIARTILEKA
jgi:hypothetical protein